jgi:hypothetical protein
MPWAQTFLKKPHTIFLLERLKVGQHLRKRDQQNKESWKFAPRSFDSHFQYRHECIGEYIGQGKTDATPTVPVAEGPASDRVLLALGPALGLPWGLPWGCPGACPRSIKAPCCASLETSLVTMASVWYFIGPGTKDAKYT